jgi:hypothetical protein
MAGRSRATRRRCAVAKCEKRGDKVQVGRAKLTAEESLKRMQEFARRKESFVAAVRMGKGRGVAASNS